MSVKDLVDAVRNAAGVPLPLNKARDAVCRVLYGRPYSAALAAEAAGIALSPAADQERADGVAKDYRIATAPILTEATPFLEGWSYPAEERDERDDDDESSTTWDPPTPRAITALRHLVEAVHAAETLDGKTWSLRDDIDSVLRHFGTGADEDYADYSEGWALVINDALDSDGFSLPDGVEALLNRAFEPGRWRAVDRRWHQSLVERYPANSRHTARPHESAWLGVELMWRDDGTGMEVIDSPLIQHRSSDAEKAHLYERIRVWVARELFIDPSCCFIGNAIIDPLEFGEYPPSGRFGESGADFVYALRDIAARVGGPGRVLDVWDRWAPSQALLGIRETAWTIMIVLVARFDGSWEVGHHNQQLREMLRVTAGTPRARLDGIEESPEGQHSDHLGNVIAETVGFRTDGTIHVRAGLLTPISELVIGKRTSH